MYIALHFAAAQDKNKGPLPGWARGLFAIPLQGAENPISAASVRNVWLPHLLFQVSPPRLFYKVTDRKTSGA
jgi:hypothetical protein